GDGFPHRPGARAVPDGPLRAGRGGAGPRAGRGPELRRRARASGAVPGKPGEAGGRRAPRQRRRLRLAGRRVLPLRAGQRDQGTRKRPPGRGVGDGGREAVSGVRRRLAPAVHDPAGPEGLEGRRRLRRRGAGAGPRRRGMRRGARGGAAGNGLLRPGERHDRAPAGPPSRKRRRSRPARLVPAGPQRSPCGHRGVSRGAAAEPHRTRRPGRAAPGTRLTEPSASLVPQDGTALQQVDPAPSAGRALAGCVRLRGLLRRGDVAGHHDHDPDPPAVRRRHGAHL
ncbi:MAG: hypothetical protein AVDCRST_MAG89-4817, partial [uncultured Gemmatimonadetes bacterium]